MINLVMPKNIPASVMFLDSPYCKLEIISRGECRQVNHCLECIRGVMSHQKTHNVWVTPIVGDAKTDDWWEANLLHFILPVVSLLD